MTYVSRRCACGGAIYGDADNPQPAVELHNELPRHLEWRMDQDAAPLPRLTVGPLTVERLAELGFAPKPESRALSNNGYRRR